MLVLSLVGIGSLYQSNQTLKGELNRELKQSAESVDSLVDMRAEIEKLKKELTTSKQKLSASMNPFAVKVPTTPYNQKTEEASEESTEVTETEDQRINPLLPHIVVTPEILDLGIIRQADGIVDATYKITNNGGTNLKIYSSFSSCGCTTAPLKNKILKPGESTDLDVQYDPNYFKGSLGLGEIEKRITIISSDPSNSFYKIYLKINVIP